MSIDYTKLQLLSSSSSNKIVAQGSASFTIPALPGAGEATNGASIVHGQNTDNLLFQVTTADLGYGNGVVLPWQSNDGRVTVYAYIDTANLTVRGITSDSSGFGFPAKTITFYYRVLVP